MLIVRKTLSVIKRTAVTTHFSRFPREKDLRWKSIDMKRHVEECDVVIVGGGPSGLSAAIRLKQMANKYGCELRVCLIEKGPYVGAHTLSGACIETKALDELIPEWKTLQMPHFTPVTEESFYYLMENSSMRLPIFKGMPIYNVGNYIVRLGHFVKWLGQKAEEMGVEIYTGFAANQILYDNDDGISDINDRLNEVRYVRGIATNDVGIAQDGSPKASFERGMEIRAKLTLFAEGARGHLTKRLMASPLYRSSISAPLSNVDPKLYDLGQKLRGQNFNPQPQTFGIGYKELWEVNSSNHRPGLVEHTIGFPLDYRTYGGSFVYHLGHDPTSTTKQHLVALGMVIGLDYHDPYINTFREFQKMKTHPHFLRLLSGEGVKRIGYGARALNEGGYQSIPRLTFPGGCLSGCASGFLNVAKIKGTHNAMKSGMIAAESMFDTIFPKLRTSEIPAEDLNYIEQSSCDGYFEPLIYEKRIRESWVWSEMYATRNIKPSFETKTLGIFGGILYTGLIFYMGRGREPWTLYHKDLDNQCLESAGKAKSKRSSDSYYPKPNNIQTFDILSSVALTGTNHNSDQPCHLTLKNDHIPEIVNWSIYAGPEGRYCPAFVYEYVPVENADDKNENSFSKVKLQINAQNCIHCKTCDIKDPTANIDWVAPEGGGGPSYDGM